MGLIDRIFGRAPKTAPADSRFETITAYQPRFSSWGGQIYESDLVRAAVDAKARHVGKLQYRMTGTARQKLYTATRTAPNPWYTWPQFLERCSNIYEIQNNLFIVPVLDKNGDVSGYFPVLPSACEIVQRGSVPYLRYTFMNGQKRSMELSRCAVITKHQLKDDFFGEPNKALDPTMQLVSMYNQGIIEGVKNAATYRFMAQMTGKIFDDDLRKERERFDKNNFQGGYFGVPESVIRNDATSDVMDSFFNGSIEPFAIKLSDAFSRLVFTERERNGGNAVTFTANRLQYMNVSQKVSMAKELGDRGILMIDEIRELFNYEPLPDGVGQHAPIRGEYYMVDEGRNDGGNDDE